MSDKGFIFPPVIKIEGHTYHGCNSYSEYNYLRKGIISWIKRRHFNIALSLVKKGDNKYNVIDFGCSDGIFLPTLSHYFSFVLGIENNKQFIDFSEQVIKQANLHNVQIIDSCNKSLKDLKNESQGKDFQIIFLLEVIEHIGSSWRTQYEDRILFLQGLFSLLHKDGEIIISVPKMTGFSFFIQHSALFLLNLNRSRYSLKEFIKAVIFKDVSMIENCWVPNKTHKGFNHKKLESILKENFSLIKIRDDFFQILYVIKLKDSKSL